MPLRGQDLTYLHAVLDYTAEGMIIIDEQGTVRTFNKACEHIFGYAVGEVVGNNVKMLMPEPTRGEHDGYLDHYKHTGEGHIIGTVGREVEGLKKDGTIFPLELSISVMEIGGQRMFSGIVRDISARKKAEKALQDSEAQLRAVVDYTAEGMIIIDEKGTIHTFNKSCEHTFGYFPGEVVGNNVKMLMPEPTRGEHDGYLDHYMHTGEGHIIGTVGREVEGLKKDGTVFPLELSISVISVGGQRMFSGILRDISARKKAELEREKLIEELTAVNEELEQFAYIASHDLQEPLRMVINFTGLLGSRYKEQLDDKGREYIRLSTDAASRMQALISDLLEYARLGREAERFTTVDCAKELEQVMRNMQEAITNHKVEITHDVLPVITGNPIRFMRLLQNLIGNAIKYQPESRIPCIHVGVRDRADEWVFHVRDNGIGIKADYLEKIFLPFKRLHSSAQFPGSGIGLAICRKIAESHGGRIWAESTAGKGSVFYFTIPKQEGTPHVDRHAGE